MEVNNMDHKTVSARGGKKTMKLYGSEHFSDMGHRGAVSRLKKYGTDYYKELSRKGVEARRAKAQAKKSLLQRVVESVTNN